jgi:acetyl esterase/lipase
MYMKNIFRILFFTMIIQLLFSCGVAKHKNITYLPADATLKTDDMKLDVFSPEKSEGQKDVFIFLHGGGWAHGKKSQYSFFGKRLARKGVVAVIVDYPLSPKANYNDMAIASAKAVKWVKENIAKYGGDPERIFISGHSAGGHLAALIAVRENYFYNLGLKDPVKGVILIDAAGLDMNKYLMEQEASGGDHYLDAFTKNHNTWIEASPIYFLHAGIPPMLIFTGEKTYSNIRESNVRFVTELSKYAKTIDYKVVKRRRHAPMIFQFYNARNPLYGTILKFMKDQK